jgi:DNA-binding NarL/FixJ family response regulator
VSPTRGKELPADSIRFSHREQEVVGLIAKGQRNKKIAESLHIPDCTVNLQVRNILENLELSASLQIDTFVRKEKSG